MAMLERASDTLRDALQRLRGERGEPTDLTAPRTTRLGNAALRSLGLERQPFGDESNGDRLYIDDAIRMQLNILTQQLTAGEVLPLLKGEGGSGKTSVLIRLMLEQNANMHFFVTRGSRGLTAYRITLDILRVLVRPIPSDPQLCYLELTRQLRKLVRSGEPAVLVVDDADAMPDSELQNLLALHDSLRNYLNGAFRTLLAGEPGLEGRLAALDSRQLAGGYMIATDVRPLPRPRLGHYLDHRLQTAGYSGESPFSDSDLDRILAASGGLPGPTEIAATTLIESRYGETGL